MDNFNLTFIHGIPCIESNGFKIDIQKNRKLTEDDNGPILEATLYKEEGVFLQDSSFIFEALPNENQPGYNETQFILFNTSVDFFFKSVLGTELYVKSVPQYSSLNTLYKNKIFSNLNMEHAD